MNLRQLVPHVPRPGAPALDFSAERVIALTAEVEYLRREMHSMQVLVDEVLDRESMHVYDPGLECLTTAAAMARHAAPRARHQVALTEATMPGVRA